MSGCYERAADQPTGAN